MSSRIIPTLRYHDASRAIDFLVEAFGFERGLVVEGENGTVEHAELTYGTGMLMLGSVRPDNDGDVVSTVRRTGRPTGGIHVVVEDVEAHAQRSSAAGAEILVPPEDQDYGGMLYSCRDLEGNVWSFGSYDPWAS